MTSPWFQVLRSAPEARVRLFAFASAGSGASAFRAWLPHLPPWLELHAAQLPAREGRAREPALRSLDAILDAIVPVIAPLRAERPFAIFGHSLGGRIAFEIARRLEADGGPAPTRVVLAASMEPSAMTDLDRRCHALPDAEFEAYVAGFGNFPEDLRRFPRQFKAVMDLLRADLEVFATAATPADPPLRAPLTVLGARGDEAVSARTLEPWATRAGGPFALEWHDGGHFFPVERAPEVVARLASLLDPAASA
jgi:medium-chain acyl-[acyl-carrier-protein] hydrolase